MRSARRSFATWAEDSDGAAALPRSSNSLPSEQGRQDSRSYHLLRFLAARYRVHLGTFIDREEDRVHEAALDAFCESKLAVMLDLRAAKLRSVAGFVTGEALDAALLPQR